MLRNDGLGPENLFWHHGNRYTNNMLSWYDEHYNGRWKENNFPPGRQWNSHQLAWGPEKSDYPLQGDNALYEIFIGNFSGLYLISQLRLKRLNLQDSIFVFIFILP